MEEANLTSMIVIGTWSMTSGTIPFASIMSSSVEQNTRKTIAFARHVDASYTVQAYTVIYCFVAYV